jgi:hypothetical protein
VHEENIRELEFGPEGISVSEPLANFHGVLTGVPVDPRSARLLSNE